MIVGVDVLRCARKRAQVSPHYNDNKAAGVPSKVQRAGRIIEGRGE